jgi:hypothetical protein
MIRAQVFLRVSDSLIDRPKLGSFSPAGFTRSSITESVGTG